MALSTPSVPVSEILKSSADSDEPKKKSREDWRKAKELEEARKAGTAPAAVDEEGKDINPHIPQYISSAPWYYSAKGPTLKHQRIQDESVKKYSGIDEWYKRGVDSSKVVTKYRKGACENCGAVTHQKKDCMERPRKIGAKFTGAKIAPDEFVQPELSRDYDGKRDRWAGYDPAQHKMVIERYARIDEAKRQLRAEKLNSEQSEEAEEEEMKDSAVEDGGEDEDKYVDEVDMPGTKVDSKQRITVRNLRIREDTAKYLRNLDPNSAYYDPKTRSMRDNPYAGSADTDVDYAGENFVRFTGDTLEHAKVQLFAWEAHNKGVDVHPLGEPTRLEVLKKEFVGIKEEFKQKGQEDLIKKYGGEEHLKAPPRELLLAQTEYYAEYTRYGTVIKGQEKEVVRSRYEEDVLINNHTTVWGSFWHSGKWGYKCCHSFIKGSYCTGEAGRLATAGEVAVRGPAFIPPRPATPSASSSSSSSSGSSSSSSSSSEDEEEKERKKKKQEKKKSKKKKLKVKKLIMNKNKKPEEKTEEEQLQEALKKEEEAQREGDRLAKMDDRKRPYNSMFEVQKPTDVEMEAYYMKKKRDEDPMANFL
ncbi:pre-mRNA-splicing factor SLU7 [Halyomorpha halys]|uniref:pre-mRNA-splicing factor SLU7 n=1 Tax=Halyomorpha halys TaxID=286706 RepID=UPI0006D4CFAF|nr:pre-mRNA-splicing factor SLU7 [Halyomorpha halys]